MQDERRSEAFLKLKRKGYRRIAIAAGMLVVESVVLFAGYGVRGALVVVLIAIAIFAIGNRLFDW
jgi:hypothetical protein